MSAYPNTYTTEHLHNRNICIPKYLHYRTSTQPKYLHICISGYLHARTFTQSKYLHIQIPTRPNIYTIEISAYPDTCTSEHLQPKYPHIQIPTHPNIYTIKISAHPNTYIPKHRHNQNICTSLPIQIPPPKQSIPPNTSGPRIESLKKYA